MSADVKRCLYTAGNQRRAGTPQLRGAYFVLQLHDELIYETTEEDLIQVSKLFGSSLISCILCCVCLVYRKHDA